MRRATVESWNRPGDRGAGSGNHADARGTRWNPSTHIGENGVAEVWPDAHFQVSCGLPRRWTRPHRPPSRVLPRAGIRAIRREVLLVAPLFAPENRVGTYRSLYLARQLEDEGFGVRVLTLPASAPSNPGSPLSEVFPDRERVLRLEPRRTLNDRYRWVRAWITAWVERDAADAERTEATGSQPPGADSASDVRTLIAEGVAFPDRFEGWVDRAIARGTQWLSSNPPDLVFVSGPPFSAFRAATELANRFGCPLAIDFRDPWSTATGDYQRYRHPVWRSGARRREGRAIAQAAVVTFNSPGLHARAEAELPRFADRFRTILNGTDAPRNEQRRPISPDEPLRFSHVGSLYSGRHLRGVVSGLDAALGAREGSAQVQVIQVGPRCSPDLLSNGAPMADGLTVDQTGPLSRDEALARAAKPGVLIVVQMEQGGVQIPSKLFDDLASGNPVLVVAPESGSLWAVAQRFPRCHRIDLEHSPRNVEVLQGLIDQWQAGELFAERAVEDTAHLTRRETSRQLIEELRPLMERG